MLLFVIPDVPQTRWGYPSKMYQNTNACNSTASINENRVFIFFSLRCVILVRLWHCHRFMVILPMWSSAGVQFWPLLACFLYCICYRGMLHVMLLGEDSHVSLVVSVGLLLHTHHCFCTRTRGRWFMMIQWSVCSQRWDKCIQIHPNDMDLKSFCWTLGASMHWARWSQVQPGQGSFLCKRWVCECWFSLD